MRAPDQDDVRALAKALAASGVEYVLIGGAAMALHGFPRMTRDIDLLLPVDTANATEIALAEELREGGFTVWQN